MNTRYTASALLMSLLMAAPSAQAAIACSEDRAETASAMVEQARQSADPVDRAIQLKRSLRVCENVQGWLELGRAELDLDNVADAVYAFENARDAVDADERGELGRSELQLRTLGTAWLAESYRLDDELALASVAVQEARSGFEALGQATPQRLLNLQAELDDALAAADESVLTRSLQLQHERATRGIGVRPVVRQTPDSPALAGAASDLSTAYDPSASTTVVASAPATTVVDAPQATATTESRLNIPVLFAFDSATLATDSEATIERLGRALGALQLDGAARVRILGHTDRRGDAGYNQSLSEQRAQSVLARLDGMQVTEALLEARGLGESQLRYAGSAADDHRRNRRVEVVVVR